MADSLSYSGVRSVKSPRRSLLFMPGDSRRKIEKAAGLDVDTIIMDLEDGVALNHKEEARATTVEALQDLDFGWRERLVRINPVNSKFAWDDLADTVVARPDGYVVPKVEEAGDLLAVSHYLTDHEHSAGWPAEGIRLLALIETAKSVMNLREIAAATPRLDALLFGAEDLAGDIGAVRTRAGWEIFYARSAVVVAAAAYNLQAIDTVFVDLNDLQALEAECTFARQMGYAGKLAIHPRQVPVINRVFSPAPDEIAQAQRLIDAFAAQQAAGAGAFELDGKMVDMPVVRAARRVLERARAAGIL